MGTVLLEGRHEQGQECEGDDGQVVYLAYSGNEIRNQVNGGKGIKSRQHQENKLAFGEKARFSFPAAEIIVALSGIAAWTRWVDGKLVFMGLQG